jgi:acetylornithine deacetylase
MGERLTARQILERLVAFPTVSRDTNLPLIDWVEDYLAGWGVTSHRVYDATGTKATLFANVGPDVAGGIALSGHVDVSTTSATACPMDAWWPTRSSRLGRFKSARSIVEARAT